MKPTLHQREELTEHLRDELTLHQRCKMTLRQHGRCKASELEITITLSKNSNFHHKLTPKRAGLV
uniref:Uncharacterized protein n=1 Tax=Romanomermis culicivorax TaxID=13658 RepID=A0A915I6L0_ROMCU